MGYTTTTTEERAAQAAEKRSGLEADLAALVERIARHQDALGLGDDEFVSRYSSYLRSVRTWRYRLRSGDFSEVSVARVLPRLRILVREIDGSGELGDGYFESMPVYGQFRRRLAKLQGQRTDRRVMLFVAHTGCGKSACAKIARDKDPKNVVHVELVRDAKDRPIRILNLMIAALGGEVALTAEGAMRTALALLAQGKTVIIDEAHYGGGVLLALIKSLVDQTPSRFVLMAFPTLWRRLLRQSDETFSEAQQLFGRCMKPIFTDYEDGTTRDNVAELLRRGLGLGAEAADTAAALLPLARKNGNLRFIADLIDEADALASERSIEPTSVGLLDLARALAQEGGHAG